MGMLRLNFVNYG